MEYTRRRFYHISKILAKCRRSSNFLLFKEFVVFADFSSREGIHHNWEPRLLLPFETLAQLFVHGEYDLCTKLSRERNEIAVPGFNAVHRGIIQSRGSK